MSACRHIEPLLHGHLDGELGLFQRWRVRRHLGRCPSCRVELEGLAHVGGWVREALGGPVPGAADWPALEAGLRAVDARIEADDEPAQAFPRGLPQLLGPLGAGAALVAAGLAGVFLLWPEPHQSGVVRSLYSLDQPVMVLDEADRATIIWVMDETPPEQRTERIEHVVT